VYIEKGKSAAIEHCKACVRRERRGSEEHTSLTRAIRMLNEID
jgi:hypothetical protein